MATKQSSCAPTVPTHEPSTRIDDEDLTIKCCTPLTSLTAPVEVGNIGSGRAGKSAFFAWPLLGPLLFENETSDARDHCANERSMSSFSYPVLSYSVPFPCHRSQSSWIDTLVAFLSYLRLSVFMAVLSVAITLSFHLKSKPTKLERQVSKPLGAIFWVLSVVMLALGLANYIKTVNKYSKKEAIVQSGWRTQLILGTLAFCIVGSSIVLLVVTRVRQQTEGL